MLHSADREVASFLGQIEKKQLPIKAADAYEFGHAVMEFNPPQGWLERVAQGAQYIDKATFENDLEKLTEMARKVLKNKPYGVVLSKKDKSDYWVYSQMRQLGLPDAISTYTEDDDKRLTAKHIESGEKGYYNPFDKWVYELDDQFTEWGIRKQKKPSICTFDDFSISGGQIKDLFRSADWWTVDRQNGKAFVCYGSKPARIHLKKYLNNIRLYQSGADIETLQKSLPRPDINFIKRLEKKLGIDWEFSNESVLFWTWHKVPDNIPQIFTGQFLPPLIRAENFWPPYKPQPNTPD